MTRKRIATVAVQIDTSNFVKSCFECLSNAARLVEQAQLICGELDGASTSYALALLAQEEAVKAFLLLLVAREGLPWNPLVHRSLQDHKCKQLWFLVLEALVADTDDYLAQSPLLITREVDANGRLLEKVADVLNWYRYAKIEAWDQGYCDWDEEPADKRVKRIACGKLDKKKQSALYVGIGGNGEVSSRPADVEISDAEQAIKTATHYHSYVYDLIGAQGRYTRKQIDWISGLLKAIFTPPVRTGRVNRDMIPGVEIYEETRVVLQAPNSKDSATPQ